MSGIPKKKILITGATGYLGAKLCLQLRDQNYPVIAVCRKTSQEVKNIFEGIHLIEADLTDLNSLSKLEAISEIDTIIHTVSLDHNQSQKYSVLDIDKTNILPTWELLNRFTKKNISKFIYLSTIQVLGNLPNGHVTENALPNPRNMYALTHLMCENMLNYYNQTSETTCINIRLSNGYGAPVFENNNCWWLLINDLCKMAYYDKKIILKSDGTAERDFIHVSDIVKAVQLLIEHNHDKKDIHTFNISSGKTYNLLQIANIIQKIFSSKFNILAPIYYNTSELLLAEPIHTPHYVVSHNKIKELGYSPKISIEQGVDALFDYLKSTDRKKINEPIS